VFYDESVKKLYRLGCLAMLAGCALAATDVRVSFTLNTTDPYGAPIKQNRLYWVYRPDNLSKTTPVPMILVMDGGVTTYFHRKADQVGFVLVNGSFSGNSSGTPGTGWNAEDPRVSGFEDIDYITEVITRVRASDNADDTFIVGLSKGGHISLAYACERPSNIRAAGSVDEFMQLGSNIPSAPVPIIMFQGTADTNVPYTMVKDTVDAWRAVNGLLSVAPVTTYEASSRIPGRVSQATWRGGTDGTQVAFVTIIGGSHTNPTPSAETGYDCSDGMWAFFSQFLTPVQGAPKIVSHPVNNIQIAGQPASFSVTAAGSGPLSYQWQRDGADIPGATASWITVPAVAEADSGATFRAVVRNDAGSATSEAANLTVNAAPAGPSITTQPADQAVTAGQPVSFTVAATGTAPLRYQWQKNGINIAGATAATLAIPAAISADCGASFSVVVSNVTSARAQLTVTPAPDGPVILANPARARVLVGATASFSVAASSATPMSYQWQKGTGAGNMADIPGATEATYTTPATTLADHLTLLRCIVSNDAGNATSASEMLFVTAAPTAPTKILSDITASAQAGVPFQYTIVSSGGTAPITYSAAPLPPGLSLDPDTGIISGTPAEAATTRITLDASNTAGKVSAILSLTVTAPPAN
jgi:poly(3-hydroxybutyrate) depolymerase